MDKYKIAVKWVIVTFYIMMMCIMFMQVISRYVFNSPTSWAEESSRYLFIWISYLGAAMGISSKAHIGVDYFIKHVSVTIQKKIFYLTSVISILMLVFVFIQGIRLTVATMGFPCYTIPFLPQGFAFLAIPVGIFLMMVATVETMYDKIKNN